MLSNQTTPIPQTEKMGTQKHRSNVYQEISVIISYDLQFTPRKEKGSINRGVPQGEGGHVREKYLRRERGERQGRRAYVFRRAAP